MVSDIRNKLSVLWSSIALSLEKIGASLQHHVTVGVTPLGTEAVGFPSSRHQNGKMVFRKGLSVNWTYDFTDEESDDRCPTLRSDEFPFEGERYVVEFILHEDEEPRHSKLSLLAAEGGGGVRRGTRPFDVTVLVWGKEALPGPRACTQLARGTVSEVPWSPDYDKDLVGRHVTIDFGFDEFTFFRVQFTFLFESRPIYSVGKDILSIGSEGRSSISEGSGSSSEIDICSPESPEWNSQQNASENADSSTQTDCAEGTDSDFPSNLDSLSRDLANLLKEETLPDVKLKCGGRDGPIPAHRAVLAARSDVFAAMFRSDMAESRSGDVDVTDVEDDVIDPFLQYVYSGKIQSGVTDELVPGLYSAADKYAVHALRETCRDRMVRGLTEENCVHFLKVADAHRDVSFKKSVIDYICRHEAVLKGDAWREFTKNLSTLVVEVYHSFVESKSSGARTGLE